MVEAGKRLKPELIPVGNANYVEHAN